MKIFGFWSDAESDVAKQVTKLPNSIENTHRVTENAVTMNDNDTLSQNIYLTLAPVVEVLNKKSVSPISINTFQYKKVSELKILPKQDSTAAPIDLNMYYVFSDELKNMEHFFLIDKNCHVAAYARFEYKEKSPHVEQVYGIRPLVILDAIESKMRGEYSLGPVLVQAVFEFSLNLGCEGRMILYSANKTGEVYFNYGFIPLQENTFDKLFYQGEKDLDGGIMFLTNSVIDAWKGKVNTHRILPDALRHNIQNK